jgi:hypothetical protein
MKSFEKLVEVVNQAYVDVEKFDNGNSTAGTRVRQAMLEIKKLAQEVRVDVQETKKMK